MIIIKVFLSWIGWEIKTHESLYVYVSIRSPCRVGFFWEGGEDMKQKHILKTGSIEREISRAR